MACIKLHKKIALFKIFGFAPQDIEQLQNSIVWGKYVKRKVGFAEKVLLLEIGNMKT